MDNQKLRQLLRSARSMVQNSGEMVIVEQTATFSMQHTIGRTREVLEDTLEWRKLHGRAPDH